MHSLYITALSVIFAFLSFTPVSCADEEAEGGDFVLTKDNFDSIVNGEKHALIKFYAPCTICCY